MVEFCATGKLGQLLQKFKTDFLSKLSPEDLEKEITLWVGEGFPASPDSDNSLIEKLVEVIENE